MKHEVINGDCLDILPTLDADSVDAIVTDPPAGIGFMNKDWDHDKGGRDAWVAWMTQVMQECHRVLKPGGHALVWALPRTSHWTAWAVESAGFEVRDIVMHIFGSGFPKSLNVAAAIEKMAEPKAEPKADEIEFCDWLKNNSTSDHVCATLGRRFWECDIQIVNTATKEKPIMGRRALVPTSARWKLFKDGHKGLIPDRIEQLSKPEPVRYETPGEEWSPGKGVGTAGNGQFSGWGTALKPAAEHWILARKPLIGTVAQNVQRWGTGGVNVDACRIPVDGESLRGGGDNGSMNCHDGWDRPWKHDPKAVAAHGDIRKAHAEHAESLGRWPANLCHDGSPEVLAGFPDVGLSSGGLTPGVGGPSCWNFGDRLGANAGGLGDSGSAARFFFQAPKEDLCSLCNLLSRRDNDTIIGESTKGDSLWKSMFALSAKKSSWPSEATDACIARLNAIALENTSLVQNVRSAGHLCDSCATRIAAALVGIKTSAFSEEELQAILDCTGSCKSSILIQNLASFAELWESTATIPTTKSLSILFGSVRDATASCIRRESAERAGQRCEQRRFAYIPKASKDDREEGLHNIEARKVSDGREAPHDTPHLRAETNRKNFHCTVKPTALMRWLCRLVTPPNGLILDPFAGSGSTGKAAVAEGFRFTGIELDPEYCEIARARIAHEAAKGVQDDLFANTETRHFAGKGSD